MHRRTAAYDGPYSRNLGMRPWSADYTSVSQYWSTDSNSSTYDVDHLATFTISPQRGLSTPADGLIRLRQMAASSGVWTRRLRLHVGSRDIVLVDGSEAVERFSLRLVHGALCSSTPSEGFDNTVVFAVEGDELLRRPGEIHAFQCVGCPGQDLVNDIHAAKAGKPLPSKSSADEQNVATQSEPSVYQRQPEHSNQLSVQDPLYRHHDQTTDKYKISPTLSENTTNTSYSPRSTESQLSTEERKKLDTAVLGKCFEEIEQFVARLQRAAADARDATKSEGERTRAPEAKHFYDIFQKFKLCFILLSRLKSDLTDPNASELVHVLFSPLSVVIEASRGTDGQPHLGSQVIAPLLTTASVDLLHNCLTSKEMDVWQSLGRAWNIPKERWTEAVPRFHLVFANGKSPPAPWLHDLGAAVSESPAEMNGTIQQSMNQNKDLIDVNNARMDSRDGPYTAHQDNYLLELRARGAKICTVTRGREASNERELAVETDDIVEVLDDSKNWWNVRNYRGDSGFVPNNVLRRHDS